jgi:aminopeptidase N
MGLKTVAFLSKELPGVPFPYPKITIFNGGGGMESPMMVNEGASSSYTGQFFVTSHEITHTYFPFYMGINERKYAWMDEGWATMLPIELQAKEGKFNPLEMNAAGFSLFAGSETELPMIIPSVFLFGRTYRSASYGRPGLAYYYLMQTMGKENFKKALKEYIRRWHGKHPLPYDFFFTFNDVAGENLDWFFEPWFCERGYPDVSIDKVEFSEDSVNIVVRKDGLLPVPIDLILTFENGSKKEIYKTPVVWKNGNEKLELKIKTSSPPIKVELSTKFIPDVDKSHNLWEAKN